MTPTLPLLLVALLQGPSLGPTVDSLAAAQQFSGVVLIAHGGAAIVEKAYGPGNNIETAFNLGSINKLFTRIAMRQGSAVQAQQDVVEPQPGAVGRPARHEG